MPAAFDTSYDFALQADASDSLARFKQEFYFPKHENKDVIYFCGNSLGLQPKNVEAAVNTELTSWRELAVGGYFNGPNPWLYYQQYARTSLSKLVGCLEPEVTVMNALTVNLHLLMLSFYKPRGERNKILMEAGAFPSDQYAAETLLKHYDLDPADCIVEVAPRTGEKTLHTEDILQTINDLGNSLAMVLFGGMNYYTGQLFDMQAITAAAHKNGAVAGFDLAHVAGNVPVQLHNWEVDFAVWCSYKYLNAGPGAAGGVYIHEKHSSDINTPRLGGWWGNNESTRFKMEKGFVPKADAGGWNISTAQVFNTVALKASLSIFDEAGIDALREKSLRLTAYLEYLLQQLNNPAFEIITPADPTARGAQLSLYFKEKGKEIHERMISNGIIVDYREPGVIRVAPAPLYCSFADVHRFYSILKEHF
ncbi:kynureninase [Sediminibacterium ginsengisoli]|uniref:Kynureninase n=1 Tax=Sediminibacterium ginsengisoli TaxID=413434 RepID=A0A1T4LFU6_9BACT|nr:kynureninase [Sediminibacterium ginsengisoli]SJZ53506.1 Kynureninase [Sediminibacterium ginsengisoli]